MRLLTEVLNDLEVVALARDGQRRASVCALQVHVAAGLHQKRHDVMTVAERSFHQCSLSELNSCNQRANARTNTGTARFSGQYSQPRCRSQAPQG